jgi:hypothetical protein
MFLFDPPAHAPDMKPEGRAHWHAHMAATTAVQRALLVCELQQTHPEASERDLAYVDPRKTEVPEGTVPAGQPWGGFPRYILEVLAKNDPVEAWRIADETGPHSERRLLDRDGNPFERKARIHQDEYLEWHADEDEHGIFRVSMTCEGPEYWEFLAQQDLELVRRRYSEMLRREIPLEDIVYPHDVFVRLRSGQLAQVEQEGAYNPFNRWNTDDGAVHLTQRNNTLGAEVNLASRATVARFDTDDEPVEEKFQLICCAGYGGPNRDSDPSIGATANQAARSHQLVTLTNPIGLYISAFDSERIGLPEGAEVADGTQPDTWWSCVRGEEQSADGQTRMLRIEYEIPDRATMPAEGGGRRPLRLADLEVDGVSAARAGALAQLVTMHLFVTAWNDPANAERPGLRCTSTCCRDARDGSLELCDDPGKSVYPGLFDPNKRAPECGPDDSASIEDGVYRATYAEALQEARDALGVPTPEAGFAAAGPDPGLLAKYAAVTR